MAQQDAIEHLETFGYCLIEDAIPTAQADAMSVLAYVLIPSTSRVARIWTVRFGIYLTPSDTILTSDFYNEFAPLLEPFPQDGVFIVGSFRLRTCRL